MGLKVSVYGVKGNCLWGKGECLWGNRLKLYLPQASDAYFPPKHVGLWGKVSVYGETV